MMLFGAQNRKKLRRRLGKHYLEKVFVPRFCGVTNLIKQRKQLSQKSEIANRNLMKPCVKSREVIPKWEDDLQNIEKHYLEMVSYRVSAK